MLPLLFGSPLPNSNPPVAVSSTCPKIPVASLSLEYPFGADAATAGFQNMPDSPPPAAASPANDMPWNSDDCSRTAKPPAEACPAAAIKAAAPQDSNSPARLPWNLDMWTSPLKATRASPRARVALPDFSGATLRIVVISWQPQDRPADP